MSAQRSEETVDAKEAAPFFRCSPRYLVDTLSKLPGFPEPVKRRPLVWAKWRVLEFRDSAKRRP